MTLLKLCPRREVALDDSNGRNTPAYSVLLGWICAAAFLAGSVMLLLLEYDITAPAPPPLPKGRPNLLTGTVLFFANERERWTQEVISGCLFAVGFVALVGVGIALSRRLRTYDVTGALMVGFLTIASTLGVASVLLELGAEQVALDSEICDCKYSAMQIISQGRSLGLAQGSSDWLLYGFLATAAAGFAVATLSNAGMSRSWRLLSGVIAGLLVLGLVATSLGASELNDLVVGIGGGILIPIWAVWTGTTARGSGIAGELEPQL